jgi:predicted nucleotidyltransferase
MSRLSEIMLKKQARKAKLRSSFDAIINQLKNLGALKIILFGSFSRLEIDTHSDLDLLLIMPSSKSGKEWMELVYDTVERGIASDILIYNQKEFKRNLSINSFLQNIVSTGKVVYEKTL